MGKNRKKNVAHIQKNAVWFIKFTPKQAEVVWELYNYDPKLSLQMSKNDFLKAAVLGHLKITKHLVTPKLLDHGLNEGISISVYKSGYKNLGMYNDYIHTKPYYLQGVDLCGTDILYILNHKFHEIHKGKVDTADFEKLTEVSWLEKMLGLVIE